mmetsp:Transcript_15027/g.33439  ORF Transcript_15027/g.33439 Transcript_15027/m.33439 type:complete len:221 (-) Transcript_15027:443-1105(-)
MPQAPRWGFRGLQGPLWRAELRHVLPARPVQGEEDARLRDSQVHDPLREAQVQRGLRAQLLRVPDGMPYPGLRVEVFQALLPEAPVQHAVRGVAQVRADHERGAAWCGRAGDGQEGGSAEDAGVEGGLVGGLLVSVWRWHADAKGHLQCWGGVLLCRQEASHCQGLRGGAALPVPGGPLEHLQQQVWQGHQDSQRGVQREAVPRRQARGRGGMRRPRGHL